MNSNLGQEIGLGPNFKGVLVNSLVKEGPADKAGVQGENEFPQGDIITALDGFPISNIHELLSYIENSKFTGEKINISIYRNNQTHNLSSNIRRKANLGIYLSIHFITNTIILMTEKICGSVELSGLDFSAHIR